MNENNIKDDYLLNIKSRHRYCECDDLIELSNKRERALALEKICDNYKEKINLKIISVKNLSEIINYKVSVLEMRDNVFEYSKYLTENINSGRLFIKTSKEEDKIIQTISCSKCKEKINVL